MGVYQAMPRHSTRPQDLHLDIDTGDSGDALARSQNNNVHKQLLANSPVKRAVLRSHDHDNSGANGTGVHGKPRIEHDPIRPETDVSGHGTVFHLNVGQSSDQDETKTALNNIEYGKSQDSTVPATGKSNRKIRLKKLCGPRGWRVV